MLRNVRSVLYCALLAVISIAVQGQKSDFELTSGAAKVRTSSSLSACNAPHLENKSTLPGAVWEGGSFWVFGGVGGWKARAQVWSGWDVCMFACV